MIKWIIISVVAYIIGIILTSRFIKKNSSIYFEMEDLGDDWDWISTIIMIFLLPVLCLCALINLMEAFLWPIFWIYYLGYWLFKKEQPSTF